MNRIALILPYFGKFNNYFKLFLRSCDFNKDVFDLFIFTDNTDEYDYPSNVKVIRLSFEDLKKKFQTKFDFEILLNKPYKLCDYKPAYGYLFYEYIKDYEYWGHCDCDLIFGNLNKLLVKYLDMGYDKLFAAGHLTLYKNNIENNTLFMKPYKGEEIYKQVFTYDGSYVFDENFKDNKNIHKIFVSDGKQVFTNDISCNITATKNNLYRTRYMESHQGFVRELDKKRVFFYENGNVVSFTNDDNKLIREEYIYIHLQLRKMKIKCDLNSSVISFSANEILTRNIPQNIKEYKKIWFKNGLFKFNMTNKRIKRKINSILKK